MESLTIKQIANQLGLSPIKGKKFSGLMYYVSNYNAEVISIDAYYESKNKLIVEHRYTWICANDFLDSHGIEYLELKDLI